ncbi:MAG: DPP IV N-terminal domain-containing protein [Anaerolineae bacterium]
MALLVWAPPVNSSLAPSGGRIAFSACRGGNWDIYSVDVVSGQWQKLTSDPAEDRDPAWSPDGTKLAFASRRNGNWDIYVLDAYGDLTRLTDDPAYDGAPAWSPDGRRIAFESSRAGDLDICVMDADGSSQVNLTPNESAGDYGPAWSPDGHYIAFTSWRYGDKDIFTADVESGEIVQLTDSLDIEESPAWSPDGTKLAFVIERDGLREIYVMEVEFPPAEGGLTERVTWLASDDSPAWSPDGERLAFVSRRPFGEVILVMGPDALGELPLALTGPTALDGPLSWNEVAGIGGEVVSEGDEAVVIDEGMSTRPEGHHHPYGFARLPGVETDIAKLNDRVDDSFNVLRARVVEETGYDFLSALSEALRPFDFYSETSEYASWHKAGRAVDLLFDSYDQYGRPRLEVVREDIGGETYWRLFLRCVRQDGSQGRPLKVNPWDLSRKARTDIAPEEGGTYKPIPRGYYVDFTTLAREYGWWRISAYDAEDFSWTWHFKALEYWHYQKRDGWEWYQAMLQVYSQEEMDRYFTWENIVEAGEDEYLIFAKGIPLPPSEKRWRKLHP